MTSGEMQRRHIQGKYAPLLSIGLVVVAVALMLGCTAALQVPNFTIALYQGAEELGGQEVSVEEVLDDGKPVVLNFWAGLCPPCRGEMPDFQEVYDQRRQQIIMLGIDVGPFLFLGTREEGRALLEEISITYPAGTTFDEEAFRSLELLGMPTTIFLEPGGKLHRKWTGILTKDKLNELIDDLLEAS